MDGEDSAAPPVEDISKWSVEEVCGFVGGLAGCAEYTQVRTRSGFWFIHTFNQRKRETGGERGQGGLVEE